MYALIHWFFFFLKKNRIILILLIVIHTATKFQTQESVQAFSSFSDDAGPDVSKACCLPGFHRCLLCASLLLFFFFFFRLLNSCTDHYPQLHICRANTTVYNLINVFKRAADFHGHVGYTWDDSGKSWMNKWLFLALHPWIMIPKNCRAGS